MELNGVRPRLEQLLQRQGAPATLCRGARECPLQVILCPLSALGEQSPPEGVHPLGGRCSDRYLLFCGCDEENGSLQPGDVVLCGGWRYLVEQTQEMFLSGRPLYQRATARRELYRKGE